MRSISDIPAALFSKISVSEGDNSTDILEDTPFFPITDGRDSEVLMPAFPIPIVLLTEATNCSSFTTALSVLPVQVYPKPTLPFYL